MLLKVEPIRNDYFDDMNSILATIAHYMNKPYSLMFTGCMGFEYSPIKKELHLQVKNYLKEYVIPLNTRLKNTMV